MNFARLFKEARLKAVALEMVQNCYQKAGTWPVDPNVMPKESYAPASIYFHDDPDIRSPNAGQSNPTNPNTVKALLSPLSNKPLPSEPKF